MHIHVDGCFGGSGTFCLRDLRYATNASTSTGFQACFTREPRSKTGREYKEERPKRSLGGLTPASSAKIHLGLGVGKIVFTPMSEGIRCFLLIHTAYGLFN